MNKPQIVDFIVRPFWNGLITAFLLLTDSIVAPLILPHAEVNHLPFGDNANFAWMAFVAWVFFYPMTKSERFKAVPCMVIGFIAASLMIWLGFMFNSILFLKLGNMPVGALLAGVIVSAAVTNIGNIKRHFFNNVNGIFYGMSITFSQSIIGWEISSWKLLCIILCYGILGLFCGWLSSFSFDKWKGKESVPNL